MYYNRQRSELLRYIQSRQNRVLEVGCAEGLLGESLKQQGLAAEVTGIELFPDAARVAETRLDRVICGDIESMDRDGMGLEPGSFDCIICGDVLEHLRDPWAVLSWLASRLKPGGKLIASIPNVRYWSVVFPLLFRGEWRYQSQGILDRTHLRFFTKTTAMQLLEQSGLTVTQSEPMLYRKIDRAGMFLSFGLLAGLFAFQWVVVGSKNNS